MIQPIGAPGHVHFFEDDGTGERRFACKCGAWVRVDGNHLQLAGGYCFGSEVEPFAQMAIANDPVDGVGLRITGAGMEKTILKGYQGSGGVWGQDEKP